MTNPARTLNRPRFSLLLAACALFLSATAAADPAGRIGRIAWLSGSLQLTVPASGESFSAPVNQPLTAGDILRTDADSRAEIQIGSMTVRLDAESEIELAQLDDENVRLVLNHGHGIVRLPTRDAANDFALDTQEGQLTAGETGTYRFDADSRSSSATVYFGRLHFAASDAELDVSAGQSAQFWLADRTRSRFSSAFSDDFSKWSAERDRRLTDATYTRYVSPEMTGAEDLDAYGDWSQSAEFGPLWIPREVAPDWAPYRTGHWAWVAPWGWNWVGHEPWGFAPFHYGRWVQHRGRWGWAPGTRVVRPVYSPAMVGWAGSPGISLSFSIGNRPNAGWFPLAPRDAYVPTFRSSPSYVRNVNRTHVTRIDPIDRFINPPQTVTQDTRYHPRPSPRTVTVASASNAPPHRRSERDERAERNEPNNRNDRHEPRTQRPARPLPEAQLVQFVQGVPSTPPAQVTPPAGIEPAARRAPDAHRQGARPPGHGPQDEEELRRRRGQR